MILSEDQGRVQHTGGGVQRIHCGVDAQLSNLSRQHLDYTSRWGLGIQLDGVKGYSPY